MAPFLIYAKRKTVYALNESFFDPANVTYWNFDLLREIPLTLMRDRDDNRILNKGGERSRGAPAHWSI